MCLAVPGRVLEIEEGDPAFRTASVDFCGIRKTVNLAFTPEVKVGDFILTHVGFALNRLEPEEADQRLGYLTEIGAIEQSSSDQEES